MGSHRYAANWLMVGWRCQADRRTLTFSVRRLIGATAFAKWRRSINRLQAYSSMARYADQSETTGGCHAIIRWLRRFVPFLADLDAIRGT